MLHRNCPRRINAGGHGEPMDSVVEGYTFPIPEGAAVIAINRRGSATSSLSVLTVPEKSVTERLTALESSTLANSCIVAFGDSITAMSDDKGKSYIDYVADMTGAEVYNAGIGGSLLTVPEECAFIKITSKATANGDVTVKGAVRTVTFYASVSDTVEQLASKLFEAYKAVNSILAYAVSGAEVTVRTWSGRSEPINVAAIKCETSTGVTIEARQNKYGMFETFTSNYMAYSNLDIPHMVYGLTSGDWRCQKLAAEHLSSQGVAGMVEKIATLEALSIDQVDMVTVAGGTNDYSNADWGEPDSENTALLAGGMNEIVRLLLTAKPSLKIAFFTPIPRYFGSSIAAWDDTLWGDNYVVNEHHGVMPALVEKIVAVAKRNHIAVHDMYYSIGWNRWNFAKFFKNGDDTHPAYGLEWMA
ncbi:MAG: SGNH/GDSL hydrolase family protein [Bacteroidaceae bacterium]|nr:SGNH/GDSL hydrolase family protein [Bacteroidaceae bacterium]